VVRLNIVLPWGAGFPGANFVIPVQLQVIVVVLVAIIAAVIIATRKNNKKQSAVAPATITGPPDHKSVTTGATVGGGADIVFEANKVYTEG